jgi:DNA-binding MarR family transcriptional regulator
MTTRAIDPHACIKGAQQLRIYHAILENPGLTASGCAQQIAHQSHYAAPTVLKELHRLCERGFLFKRQEPGMRPTVKAWRFYPISMQ